MSWTDLENIFFSCFSTLLSHFLLLEFIKRVHLDLYACGTFTACALYQPVCICQITFIKYIRTPLDLFFFIYLKKGLLANLGSGELQKKHADI